MLKFIKDFIIYGCTPMLGKVLAVFLMPIYTSIIPQDEYGAMWLIFSVKGIISLFSNLDIQSGVAREYNEKGIDRTKLVSTGFYSIFGISFLVFLFMVSTQSFWQTTVLSLDSRYSVAFFIMLLTIPLGSLESYFSILARFKHKPILYSIGTIIQLLIQTTIAVVGVVYIRCGINAFFIGMLCGELFSIIYFSYINRKNIRITFEKEYLRKALLFSLPTLPAVLAGWVDTSFGQVIIGKYISTTDLAVYSVALQLASMFTIVSVALKNVWEPYLYENYNKPNFISEVKKLYRFIVLALIIISIGVSLFSKEIILLLSNSAYRDAAQYFSLLCLPMCVYLLLPIASSGIRVSRDTKYIGISHVLGSITNIASLIILIPHLGVIGVPISLTASRVVTYFIMYSVSKSKGVIVLPNGILFLLIASVVVCYLVIISGVGLLGRAICVTVAELLVLFYIVKYLNIKNILIKRK